MIIITPTQNIPNSGDDSTSGRTFYNPLKNVIERRALRMVGAYAADGEPTPRQIKDCDDVLNMMLKEWNVDGLLWLRVWGTLFLNQGQASYALGSSMAQGFAPCAYSNTPSEVSYRQTSLEYKAFSGDLSCIIESDEGISSGNLFGIITNSGYIEWFFGELEDRIVTLYEDQAMTIPGHLERDSEKGHLVYSYNIANQITRPTRIISATRQLYDPISANGMYVSLDPNGGISRTDYERLPNKTVQGKIVSYFYDPQLVYGMLYVWPTPDDPRDKLILSMDRSIQDILEDVNSFDAPQEAMSTIAYCLAVELEPEYPLDTNSFQKLVTVATAKKQKLINYNREIAQTAFQIEWR